MFWEKIFHNLTSKSAIEFYIFTYTMLYRYTQLLLWLCWRVRLVRSFVCCTQIDQTNVGTCTERRYKANCLVWSASMCPTTTTIWWMNWTRNALLYLCDSSVDVDRIATPVKMDSSRKCVLIPKFPYSIVWCCLRKRIWLSTHMNFRHFVHDDFVRFSANPLESFRLGFFR